MARKSRACAEAYIGTPHKQVRRLTPPGRKRTVSGRKLYSPTDSPGSLKSGKLDREGRKG